MQTECVSVQAIVQSEEIEFLPDLSKYDIHEIAEIYYNPSYELLFAHETAPSLPAMSAPPSQNQEPYR